MIATARVLPNHDITSRPFGSINNVQIDEYTLINRDGMELQVLTWGGIVRKLLVPDKYGAYADIVLGFDELAPYTERHPYFGTITGRVANRIAKGTFTLDGETYKLAINNPPNHLHGGNEGFDRKVWAATTAIEEDRVKLTLKYTSPDGEEGYPGTLDVTVEYALTNSNRFEITYSATTDKATPVNLTHHSYFNLAGHNSGDITKQHLKINARSFTDVDSSQIPLRM